MRKTTLMLFALIALVVGGIATPSFAQDGETIAEIAAGNPDFATLIAAVSLADPSIGEALSSEGELTVFAPTNEAFAATLEELGLEATDILANQELLNTILLYHVVEGEFFAEDVIALETAQVATLQGEDISIRVRSGGVQINQANVIATDVDASNGVIHVIDRVLVPESVLRALLAEETLGSEDEPLVLLFIPSENAQEVQAGADDLAALITEVSGFAVEASVATDYSAAIEALCGQEAEIGALNTFGYILASQRDCADVGVVSSRFGSTSYGGQIITRADSGINSLEDITTETIFCRPDPLSTSGWVVPSIAMRAAGIDVDNLNVVDAGGHDGVVAGVYNGECEAGATFLDARGNLEEEYPDVRDVVVVIGLSAPIPNDTLSYGEHVPAAMRLLLTETLLSIADDADNASLLTTVYNWGGLELARDAFFDDFRAQLDAAGLDIDSLR